MNKDKVIKVVFTGGHAGTTALATIQEAAKLNKNWKIYWIGPKKPFEGSSVKSYHSIIFPKFGVSYYPIITGRLQKKLSIWTMPSLIKIPFGFLHAFSLLTKIRPKIIVSFGGFAAFPVVFVGFFLGIPVVLHEQTVVVGLANRVSSFFAKKIGIARIQSRQFFPKGKTVLVGNPLMEGIQKVTIKKKISKMPIIYITGGSAGAQTINRAIDEVLPVLLEKYYVIHHTGELDFDYFKKRRLKNYEVYNFIDPVKIGEIYEKADILIARAGANTVSEILFTGRPAILIPIPWARYDEQGKNALVAKDAGIAEILDQDKLSGETILQKLDYVVVNWDKMVRNMDRSLADLDRRAASAFIDLIDTCLQ